MASASPRGSGPGVITPDGSAVELYTLLLPPGAGPEIVHAAIPDGASIERHKPSWFDEAVPGERVQGAIVSRLRDVSRPGPGLLSATVEYRIGESVWAQWFTARRLDGAELSGALAESGLAVDAYLNDDRTWVRAVPVP